MENTQAEHTWFLAQVKPNAGKIALRNLQRQGFLTFQPLHEETRRKSGRFVTMLRPLFSGYVFVAFDTSKGGWRAISNTYGITRLVSFGGKPQPVPRDLITQLMQRCDNDGKLLPPPVFSPGDRVEISSGPFAGFTASVEKISPDRRIWVLMELMGQKTRVAVQEEAVQII